jgi:hypothetical protein
MRNSAGWTSSTLANFLIIASPANAEPAEAERADDVLGRAVGERIWPEHFGADHFTPFKHHPRTWAALYQQRPAPEGGRRLRGRLVARRRTDSAEPAHLRHAPPTTR